MKQRTTVHLRPCVLEAIRENSQRRQMSVSSYLDQLLERILLGVNLFPALDSYDSQAFDDAEIAREHEAARGSKTYSSAEEIFQEIEA
jgi:hypothetical protein